MLLWIRSVFLAILSSRPVSVSRLAIVMAARLGSRVVGERSFVYGWCAHAVASNGPFCTNWSQPGPLCWLPLPSTQNSDLMNVVGYMGERERLRSVLPLGAVSPMRIVSFACPVPTSPWWPAKYSER